MTTDAVLIETHNWFARSPTRDAAATALSSLSAAVGWSIVHASVELIERGRKRYAAHPDETWSLTDCISMEVASDEGVKEVAARRVVPNALGRPAGGGSPSVALRLLAMALLFLVGAPCIWAAGAPRCSVGA